MIFESSQSKNIQRPKKIRSTSATSEHSGHLRGFWAMPKSQSTSSASIINHCHSLRKRLETLTSSTYINNHCHGLREKFKILILSTPINNHCCGLRKVLETQISSTSTSNYCHDLRKGLEIQLVYITTISFFSDFDILEVISSNMKTVEIGYAL